MMQLSSSAGLVLGMLLASLAHAAEVAAQDAMVPVLIGFQNAPGPNERALVARHGGVVDRQFHLVPAIAARLPAAAVARMRNERGVRTVEPDGLVEAHDIERELSNTWGVYRIGCGQVYAGTFDTDVTAVMGAGVKVAVIDSGTDYLHPDLIANYAGGYDFVNNDHDPMDDNGHGTHVAGTVAAVRDGYGVVGAGAGVQLYGVKVLNSAGSGQWSWIIAGLQWCVDNGIEVANFSLGSSGHPGSTVENAFRKAEAAGMVLVASAGNSGQGDDTVGYPGKFASVIAVASTTKSDTRSSFSSTGPNVELAAPGSSIYSTVRGGGYGYMSGTSMAAPHVAGVAALVISAGLGDLNGDGMINDDARLLLLETADDLGATGPDDHFGYGLVNAPLAVTLAYNPAAQEPNEPEEPSDPEEPNEPESPSEPDDFSAPSHLTGIVQGNTLMLLWQDNANVEDGFEIEAGVKVKNQITWTLLDVVGVDSDEYTTAMPEGTYQIRVRAFRDDPQSLTGWSNEIKITIGGNGGGSGKGNSKK